MNHSLITPAIVIGSLVMCTLCALVGRTKNLGVLRCLAAAFAFNNLIPIAGPTLLLFLLARRPVAAPGEATYRIRQTTPRFRALAASVVLVTFVVAMVTTMPAILTIYNAMK